MGFRDRVRLPHRVGRKNRTTWPQGTSIQTHRYIMRCEHEDKSPLESDKVELEENEEDRYYQRHGESIEEQDDDDEEDDDEEEDDEEEDDEEDKEKPQTFRQQLKQDLKIFRRRKQDHEREQHPHSQNIERTQEQQQYQQRSNCNWLNLNFCGCDIQLSDVEEMKQQLLLICDEYQSICIPWLICLSFPDCRLGGQDSLTALEELFREVGIDVLNFARADFHVYEMHRLVVAAVNKPLRSRPGQKLAGGGGVGLQRLELSLRYQEGTLAPLLEACCGSRSHRLEHLKLETRYPLEHRVRLVCMQELIMALVTFHITDPALSSSSLKIFELTHCELDDEIMALLMGGLLALKGTLEMIHLHIEGGGNRGTSGITWKSLPLLGHLLTEFPHLTRLNLEISNCRKLLQNNATNATIDEVHATATAIRSFAKALQQRDQCATLQQTSLPQSSLSLRLAWSYVGWTEEVALQLLEAATHNKSASDMSLLWFDYDFLLWNNNNNSSEHFVYQLATHLREMKHVTEISLANTVSDENNGERSNSNSQWQQEAEEEEPQLVPHHLWLDDDVKRKLLIEACQQSTSLRKFELRSGPHKFLVIAEDSDNHGVLETLNQRKTQNLEKDEPQPHNNQPTMMTRTVVIPRKRSTIYDKKWVPF